MMQKEDIFAGIHLADDCLGDKLNIQQLIHSNMAKNIKRRF